MAKAVNTRHRQAKENLILDAARLVFCREGFLNVTMQDIIDECGISRGGIYLYFSSVEEIFRAVTARRNKARFDVVRKSIDDNLPFDDVLADYMALQKERLLNMENSLLRAMYEYLFSGAEGATQEFRDSQIENLRHSVLSILGHGVKQGVIKEDHLPRLADHFIVVIEGLGVLSLSEILTEQMIDEQFGLLDAMLGAIRK